MSTQPKGRYTAEEYLALERAAEYKSEFYAGEIFAMAGASEQHNLIVANLVRELGLQLKKRPCKTYPSDMRLKVAPTGLYTYPDVMVVCGKVWLDDEQQDTVLNPTLIVEVLSPSTESADRGSKSGHYRKLDSLQEYLLVSQVKPHVEHYSRHPDHRWLLSEAEGLQSEIRLSSIDCVLPLSEIYDKVELALQ
ncbi:MAG: Uma2 family endonuclease [Acidobacteria bacterium]|nr:Uma2 family endonuclease [Acidobacteriota bacterium]MCI0626410.1 Uma2 family endonuclease [Acidobacteriota bacterium]MCI0722567.1 Uma2 family endonuclease [Acidobacteriota bacterium]